MRRLRIAGWLVLASCQAVADGPSTEPRGIAPPKRIPYVSAPTPVPAGQPVATASIPKVVRLAVVADAARRFHVDENAVVLARAEAVVWSDGSLGCPSPDEARTQAEVPGYRITASTAAGRMVYHTDRHGRVVSCRAPLSDY